ncbi:MAG: hypothetical protein WBD07_16270 [Vicinamibacterales bacterium]
MAAGPLKDDKDKKHEADRHTGSGARRVGTGSSTLVPRRCTLDGFMAEVEGNDGLDVRQAEPLLTILVRTYNSLYRIIPLQRGDCRVLVQGGQFFPQPTEAHFAGSTFGGSFLKMAWIGTGLHMEINAGGQRIITSPVKGIGIERETPPSLSGLH